MNTFEDVVDLFLTLVSDINFLDYSEEELYEELGLKTKIVIAKANVFKNLSYNKNKMDFNRKVDDREATIISHGLVVEWLTPKVFNFELLETQLGSKDFTMFSNANKLSEMRALLNASKQEFYGLISDYDLYVTYIAEDEEVE